MILLGFEHKQGEFNGNKYDNFNVHVGKPITNDIGLGYAVKTYKVKTKVLNDSQIDLTKLLNCDVQLYFNEYQQIIDIVG